MHVPSPSAGVTAVTPTERQKLVFSVHAATNTQNTSKMGTSFEIDRTNRFAKKSEVYFYRLLKATENRSKWIAAIHRSNWTPGSES